jgi:beta-xylosidase
MLTDRGAGVAGRTGRDGVAGPWQDSALPDEIRVADLVARMSTEEKSAQLYGIWVGAVPDGDGVAPHQHDLVDHVDWDALIRHGLGQLTRPFGSAPVDAATGVRSLARAQRQIVDANRFGIAAQVHEECLAGITAWGATIYPVPLAWGATFDPALIEEMANRIGTDLRSLGVHQGMAPVLDVVRDLRWGRVEETIGEDPQLVGTIGTAYVRGLESAGIVATPKHFVGYSASTGGRNLAPVHVGARELADVLLPPFEMALRDGGARSIMHSYAAVDGVPVAADADLLSTLLRSTWGFGGTVVADYFGVAFLDRLHGVASGPADAARLALSAGIDVELPTVWAYGEALVVAVCQGVIPEQLVDRALRRVLLQKCQLGLLDAVPDTASADPGPVGAVPGPAHGTVDLDPDANRALARLVAERSIVLLSNRAGVLPLRDTGRIAVVGPLADDPRAMLGCYSFPQHVGYAHPDVPMGVDIPTLLRSLRAELPGARLDHAPGCDVDGDDTSAIADAVELAAGSDLCVLALGDRAGMFGRGTSGEGCDVTDLALPGVQGTLLTRLLDTGTPVVLVLVTGRPYALGEYAERLAATVQAFFPGEEGGPALAGVLSGRVNPSGRLPVSVPKAPGGQPWTYLQPLLGRANDASSVDPTPLYPFGHGLSYTSFAWDDVRVDATQVPTDGEVTVSVTVTNTGQLAGTEVVQLYLHDPVARVVRPVVRLVGYARVPLERGERTTVGFVVHADLAAYTCEPGRRIVEPGEIELRLASSSADPRHTVTIHLVGPERVVDVDRRFTCQVSTA